MKNSWPVKNLGEICSTTQGVQIPKSEQKNQESNGYKRYLYISDFYSDENLKYVPDEYPEKIVTDRDVIMANTGTPGKAFRGVDGILSNNLFKISMKDSQLDSDYLFYYLTSSNFQRILQSQMKHGIQMHLGHVTVQKQPIVIPPNNIQKKIVERLDVIRKAQELCDQQIQKTKELFESVLDKLIIQDISKWSSVSLKDIAINFDSKRKPVTKSTRIKGEYAYYGASGIVDYVENYIFDEELLLISEDGANLLARVTPIAFPISGKTWVNNHAHVLKFKDIKTQKFVEYYLNRIDLTGYINGAAQPKLNQDNLNKIKIPYPEITIQHQIVEQLEAVQNYRKLLQKEKELLKELFNSVLDRSMKGELDN